MFASASALASAASAPDVLLEERDVVTEEYDVMLVERAVDETTLDETLNEWVVRETGPIHPLVDVVDELVVDVAGPPLVTPPHPAPIVITAVNGPSHVTHAPCLDAFSSMMQSIPCAPAPRSFRAFRVWPST
jgi:hypothetical protein